MDDERSLRISDIQKREPTAVFGRYFLSQGVRHGGQPTFAGGKSGMLLHVTGKPTITHSDGRKVTGEVVRLAQTRGIPVERNDLTYIRIDHQARLRFGSVEIVIECPFVLTVDGDVHRLDPEARIDLGPLLALYPASLSAVYVSEGAALHLDFDSGATIVVPPDAQYEAWQVHGDGWLLVCVPGTSGDIAEWTHP